MLEPISPLEPTNGAGSITESAYQRLRSDLLACRLKPGERLNINKLCSALGVSLGAVREALSRLTSEGLVIAEPQRGFCVTPISAEDLVDLTTARIEIEVLCLRRAIAAGGVEWETNLVAATHRLNRTPYRAADDPSRLSEAWSDAHRVFHEALVAGCDSQTLLRVRKQLWMQSERYRRLSVPLADTNRDLSREHRYLMQATLDRQADRAAKLMQAHLSETTRILLQAMQPATGKGEGGKSSKHSRKPEPVQQKSARKPGRAGVRARK